VLILTQEKQHSPKEFYFMLEESIRYMRLEEVIMLVQKWILWSLKGKKELQFNQQQLISNGKINK